MAKDASAFLSDIISSIEVIEMHLAGITSLKEYKENFLVVDAVERRLSIIGEALFKASKLNKDIQVSHQKKIIALRHIIVHDYDIVDSNAIWANRKSLPPDLKRRN